MKGIINTIGYTLKECHLKNFTHDFVPGTLVLESNPIRKKGNYIFKENKPNSIYLITRYQIPYSILNDMKKCIQKDFNHFFILGTGTIAYGGCFMNCIKISELESYSLVKPLQEAFIKKGPMFEYSDRIVDGIAVATVHKQMLLSKVEEYLYQDSIFMDNYYFTAPHDLVPHTDLDADTFRKLTARVKNLIPEIQFDVDSAHIYIDENLYTAARVSSADPDKFLPLSSVRIIRETYLNMLTHASTHDEGMDYAFL